MYANNPLPAQVYFSLGILCSSILSLALVCCTTTGRSGADLITVTARNTELVTTIQGIGDQLRESNQRATERIDAIRVEAQSVRDASERAILLFGEYTYIVSDLLRENKRLQEQVRVLIENNNGSSGSTGSEGSIDDSGVHSIREGR